MKEQLKSLTIAQITDYDSERNAYIIKKHSIGQKPDIKRNHCYLLELDDCLLDEHSDQSFVNNWNKGKVPLYKHMKANVEKELGSNVYVTAIYYDMASQSDINIIWEGWLPKDHLIILEEI